MSNLFVWHRFEQPVVNSSSRLCWDASQRAPLCSHDPHTCGHIQPPRKKKKKTQTTFKNTKAHLSSDEEWFIRAGSQFQPSLTQSWCLSRRFSCCCCCCHGYSSRPCMFCSPTSQLSLSPSLSRPLSILRCLLYVSLPSLSLSWRGFQFGESARTVSRNLPLRLFPPRPPDPRSADNGAQTACSFIKRGWGAGGEY